MRGRSGSTTATFTWQRVGADWPVCALRLLQSPAVIAAWNHEPALPCAPLGAALSTHQHAPAFTHTRDLHCHSRQSSSSPPALFPAGLVGPSDLRGGPAAGDHRGECLPPRVYPPGRRTEVSQWWWLPFSLSLHIPHASPSPPLRHTGKQMNSEKIFGYRQPKLEVCTNDGPQQISPM